MPGPKPKPDALKFLTRDEVLRLLQGPRQLRRARDYYLLALGYYLALRISETIVLRPEHIQVEYGQVLVPSAKRKPKAKDRKCPHTGRLLLPVPILHGEDVIRGAKDWATKREWLFQTPAGGKPISRRQAHKTFKLWAKRAGFDPQISYHSLRHSAGSHVNDAMPDNIIALRDFMRHANIATTNEYLHMLPSQVQRAREAMKRWNDS